MTEFSHVSELRSDASAHDTQEFRTCAYASCGVRFKPTRPWQRFHADACRRAFHRPNEATESDKRVLVGTPMRGVISKVSILKRGKVSAVIHFGIDEQDRARQLTPGEEIEIV